MLRLVECPGDGGFQEIAASDLADVRARAGAGSLMWVDAIAATAEEVDALGEAFEMHRLVVEDLATRDQRQKAEPFGAELLVVLHLPRVERNGDEAELILDEIDVVIGEHWIVTSHVEAAELSADTASIVAARKDLRENGAVAILTGLLDRLVDRYEELADKLSEVVEEQDQMLLEPASGDPVPELRRAARVRHSVLRLRRATGQLRELVGVLVRHELMDSEHTDGLDLELRDVYDHVVRAHDDLDVLYERLATLADMRLALTAYRQNEITKRLSAWAAILLVPTVVTGWFGMNFTHLSFLSWRNGQLLALGVVAGICGVLFVMLRRARWL